MKKNPGTDKETTVIHVEPEVEKGTYTNAANILHSPNEFIMDFLMVLPGDRRKVVSRIIISPAHAKQLARALANNVEKYETAYGEIQTTRGGKTEEFTGPVN